MANLWGEIFTAVLGGVASSGEQKADKDMVKAKGQEDRKSLDFADKLEYFRQQQLRHERSRALGSNYNQFSTVKNFMPNFKPGTGLDAMPVQPKPGDY